MKSVNFFFRKRFSPKCLQSFKHQPPAHCSQYIEYNPKADIPSSSTRSTTTSVRSATAATIATTSTIHSTTGSTITCPARAFQFHPSRSSSRRDRPRRRQERRWRWTGRWRTTTTCCRARRRQSSEASKGQKKERPERTSDSFVSLRFFLPGDADEGEGSQPERKVRRHF